MTILFAVGASSSFGCGVEGDWIENLPADTVVSVGFAVNAPSDGRVGGSCLDGGACGQDLVCENGICTFSPAADVDSTDLAGIAVSYVAALSFEQSASCVVLPPNSVLRFEGGRAGGHDPGEEGWRLFPEIVGSSIAPAGDYCSPASDALWQARGPEASTVDEIPDVVDVRSTLGIEPPYTFELSSGGVSAFLELDENGNVTRCDFPECRYERGLCSPDGYCGE